MSDRRELLDDPEESQRLAQEGQQAKLWTAMPGIVVSVDLSAQTVSVQPAIRGSVSLENGTTQSVDLPLLVDVPIVFPRAGGFAITFPVAPGDECLVVFGARCIDAWWQSGGVQQPLESRMHDLSDGFAILGPTSQPKKLTNVQNDGVELRTESRDTYIKLTPGTIFMQGDIVHTGNTTQTGDQTTSGTVTGTTDVVGGGISVKTHTHGGVMSGPSNTGVPNP